MRKEIKNGWVEMPIENILAPNEKGVVLGQGWSPQCEKQPSQSENDWGVLKTTAIQSGYFLEEENKLLPSHLEPRTQHEVKKGDLLITCAGPRNRCGVACLVRKTRRKLLISGKMYRFRINEKKATPEFVELFLLSQNAWKEIDKMKTGGSDSGLNLTHTRFKKLIIPIPPLPEQHRIVSKIEELFSELDKGVESLKTARQQLKVYRQAVLKWAFEGRLTHKNVNDGALPEGWKWVKLGEKGKLVSGQHILEKNYNFSKSGIPYFTGPADFGNYFPTVSKWTIHPKAIAKKNDVLVTVKGAGVGKINLMNIEEAAISRQLMAFSSSGIDIKYIYHFLASRFHDFQRLGLGSTVPGIDRDTILNYQIPLCKLEEQHKIVQEIETRLSVCDKLEETITHSLQQSEALRQSILKKAFEGRLVEQNPKDEPASKLLERIKAESTKNVVEKKKSRRDDMIIGKNHNTILNPEGVKYNGNNIPSGLKKD